MQNVNENRTEYLTPFHAFYKARMLSAYSDENSLVPAYASANIEVYPYQIAAANFALRSPYLKGCILGDECSLGKTYEALLIATQKWYEGKEKILIILPINMINHWVKKLENAFSAPYILIDTKEIYNSIQSENPFIQERIVITTYEFAVEYADKISLQKWDLVIFEEADRLNKIYTGESKTANVLKAATDGCFKLLITPTPIEMDIRDIYGLIYFIDETAVPFDVDEFYNYYFRRPDRYPELAAWVSKFCFRTLKSQVTNYVNFTERIPYTIGCEFTKEEKQLYEKLQEFLSRPEKVYYSQKNAYDLSLQHGHILSSSPQAYHETISGVIERATKLDVPENKRQLLWEEIKIFKELLALSKEVTISGKMKMLLSLLKQCFTRLKQIKATQKAIVFVDNITTLKYLNKLLADSGYNVLTLSGGNSRDFSILERFRNDKDIQILIATGDVTKGLDIEFCPIVINYDILSNATEMEQRISRCHRQGQKSDVLVINLISKDNFADVRYLELINKRALQFGGIFGTSDTILGNFDADSNEILESMRYTSDIASAFEQNLSEHEYENRPIIEDSLDTLFTTFTKEIADKIKITPEYIAEEIKRIDTDLWNVVKSFLQQYNAENSDCYYVINEENKTIKAQNYDKLPVLFYYYTNTRSVPYTSLKEYGMAKDFSPHYGRITLSSPIGKGVLHSIECADNGSISVDADIEPCQIGLYSVDILTKGTFANSGRHIKTIFVFIGKTVSGKILTDDECKRIMELPVISYEEKGDKCASWLKNIREQRDELNKFIPVDDILREYEQRLSPAQEEEIEQIKSKTIKQKAKLEHNLDELRSQIKAMQNQAENTDNRMEKLKLEKQLITLRKELCEKEETLFLSGIQLENEIQKLIDEFKNKEQLTARVTRQFLINVEGR